MSKPILSVAKTFVKNIFRHTELVVARDESARDAIKAINKDVRKIKNMAGNAEDRKGHKSALKLVEKGRRSYNEKSYSVAEEYFRRALEADPKCSLALTYLGHTMYQIGRQNEAIACWREAVAADPNSEGAVKARQKLEIMEQRKRKVVDDLRG
jgi:tetratricopeptide (TPR) repeat protein